MACVDNIYILEGRLCERTDGRWEFVPLSGVKYQQCRVTFTVLSLVESMDEKCTHVSC